MPGHTVLCCEINVDPPNVASDRFHGAFGFEEVGRRPRIVVYRLRKIAGCP